jgi:hypothetical protein
MKYEITQFLRTKLDKTGALSVWVFRTFLFAKLKSFSTISAYRCCMFAFLAVGIFSIEALSSQIADLRSGKISPEFSVSCMDTPENRMYVVEEIANLYGYFLTYLAHEKEQCSKLRAKGMWLEVRDADDYFPPQGKVGEFVLNLRQEMEADLMRNKEWCITTKLGVD